MRGGAAADAVDRPGPFVRVGVQAVIRDGDHVLLGLRAGGFGRGTWGLPGGHIEPGETILAAAAREVREETGILITSAKIACVTDPDTAANHHMQIGIEVLTWEGAASVCEPDRCERWCFWPVDKLPGPMFGPSAAVLGRIGPGGFCPAQAPWIIM